ncbi:sigma-70 family RNA polymerase sigma factor [Prosthecobacter sp.]|jgi:RNA polymerase sigma factor (sigma-70 family)|uniref:sigma-70 family RNA polymerase sigma factor n=1 Tax=Prosthecobacter sp. TaxID=1965333 RepID=UPI003783FADA
MPDAQALFHAHLPLADKIAGGYANIPGVSMDDVRAVAQAALHRAALAFEPARGVFEPYAAQAIRNALNSLHQKEARHARQFVLEPDAALSAFTTMSSTAPGQRLPDEFQDVLSQVRSQESRRVLEHMLASLPSRTQQILALVAEGHSYAEIGELLGVSKQAVHKAAAAALERLRDQLAAQGFEGLDSKGFLQTAAQPPH